MDANAFGAEMVALVRDFLEQEIDPLREQVAALQEQLRAIPAPKEYDVEGTARVVIDADVLPRLKAIEEAQAAREIKITEDAKELAASIFADVVEIKRRLDNPQPLPKHITMEEAKESIIPEVEALIAASGMTVQERLDAVEASFAATQPVEPKEVDMDAVRQAMAEDVQEMVDAAVAALPPAEPGKDVDPEQVAALIKETAEAILSTWDRPEDGKSVTADDVQPMVAELVDKAVAAIPVPKDGKDGADVKELLIDREGCLVATLSDGRMKTLGNVMGKDGAPGINGKDGADGRDGADGVGFDDMTFETREDGCYLVWEKGDIVKEARLPIPMDRGVYKEGGAYHGGDGVTWGGNYYIATENTSAKPDTSKDGKPWRLAVRRGRDGKDAPTKTEKPKG